MAHRFLYMVNNLVLVESIKPVKIYGAHPRSSPIYRRPRYLIPDENALILLSGYPEARTLDIATPIAWC